MFPNYDEYDSRFEATYMRHPNQNLGFGQTYRAYSVAMMSGNERENVNFGGKIILPQSALAKLASLNVEYPMLFELKNADTNQKSHAGVLEFIAEEGRAYLPHWMMQSLLLEPGDFVEIKNVTLKLGSYVKIQPQSTDFLGINDPKAVLENALRNFSTLTIGDIIQINYNSKVYEIRVLEVKAEGSVGEIDGISIIETDLQVDFAPPVGYVEPKAQAKPPPSKMNIDAISVPDTEPSPFQGSGQRLNGKSVNATASGSKSSPQQDEKQDGKKSGQVSSEPKKHAPAPLNMPFGKLFFGYRIVPVGQSYRELEEASKPKSFAGDGQTLRPPSIRRAGSSRSGTPSPTLSSSSSVSDGCTLSSIDKGKAKVPAK